MQQNFRGGGAFSLIGLVGVGALLLGVNALRRPKQPVGGQATNRVADQVVKTLVPARIADRQAENKDSPRISLSQAVGQRIIYSYTGFAPPRRLRQLIQRGEVGGVIIFKRNVKTPSHIAATLRGLETIPRPAGLEAPLLIMIDQEGGRVKRLPGPPQRSPQAIGRIGSTELARKEGVNTGRYLKSCGVNVNLAPVVDVARPGTYQEKSLRAYGRQASLVASMGEAFAEGLLEENVVPCFKHFPGLGAAPTNEDLEVNRLDIPLSVLTKVDENPFERAGERSMVMTSTAIYPELDHTPALFSKRIVTGELRHKIGFKGISITDDLEVPALQNHGSTTTRGRRAIEAGNDLLLYCVSFRETEKALRGLTKLYERKQLNSNELYETTARVLAFRSRLKNEEGNGETAENERQSGN